MSRFQIINDVNEINLPDQWVDASKFDSKNKIIYQNGNFLGVKYGGHEYLLIAKKERYFSPLERIQRAFLGIYKILTIYFSCGQELPFKSIQKLFTKKKESIHFGIEIIFRLDKEPITIDKIHSLKIDVNCMETRICQHNCVLVMKDGRGAKLILYAHVIKSIIEANSIIVEYPREHDHFTDQFN